MELFDKLTGHVNEGEAKDQDVESALEETDDASAIDYISLGMSPEFIGFIVPNESGEDQIEVLPHFQERPAFMRPTAGAPKLGLRHKLYSSRGALPSKEKIILSIFHQFCDIFRKSIPDRPGFCIDTGTPSSVIGIEEKTRIFAKAGSCTASSQREDDFFLQMHPSTRLGLR